MRSLYASEHQEQEALIERASLDHRLELLYAIPNDGKRTRITGANFKRRGMKPGMPDICLPCPSPNGFHALYIELKSKSPSALISSKQLGIIPKLNKAGNFACVCYGWEVAWQTMQDYLAGNIPLDTQNIIIR